MKTKIKIISVLIFFYSCNDIPLKFPQPVYLDNIEKIPSNFQGSFERIDDKEDTIRYKLFETFGLIDKDSLKLGSDQLIVKHQNNNLFINLKYEDYYNLYVLSRFNYLKNDSILIKILSVNTPKIHSKNDDLYILNYMLINKLFNIDQQYIDSTIESSDVLSDTLNVNQINTLLNWDRYAYRLKFNKH
jgi:hypothetical protein